MKTVILSTLRRKLGLKKGVMACIIYDYHTKNLTLEMEGEIYEPAANLSHLLMKINERTIEMIDDCKEPHKLILETLSSNHNKLIVYYRSKNNELKKKTTEL